MDHDVWQYFVDIGFKVLLLIAVFIAIVGFFVGAACGQEFDGVCRLSGPTAQWSGVAISDTQILTVAHHNQTGDLRAEFPEGSHGSFNRIGVKARVIRSDSKKDLSLLSYEAPAWLKIKSYPISREKGQGTVRGFIGADPLTSPVRVIRTDAAVNGYGIVTMKAPDLEYLDTLSGMSGSPILTDKGVRGIQFGQVQSEKTVEVVSIETVLLFLEEK
jgi:hypothetical protein